MDFLQNYTPWQIEKAVTASLLRLGLMSSEQIVIYTHYLLDNGYYDDSLLGIIDDDPIYPNHEDKRKLYFIEAIKHLDFPYPKLEQAKWIYSFFYLSMDARRPHNFRMFTIDFYSILATIEFFSLNDFMQDADELYHILIGIEVALFDLDDDGQWVGETNPSEFLKVQNSYFSFCENWLTTHTAKIETIFSDLYG